MTCYNCNSEPALNKVQVENLIAKTLDDKGFLAGAKDCEGNKLADGVGLVTCDGANDVVAKVVNEGGTNAVTGVKKLDNGEFEFTQGVQTIKTDFAGLAKKTIDFSKIADGTTITYDAVRGTLSAVNDNSELEALKAKVERDIASTNDNVTANSEAIEALKATVAQSGDTSALERKISANSDSIEANKSNIAKNKAEIDKLKTEFDALKASLDKPCTINISNKNANYTAKKTDELIIAKGSKTVTFNVADAPIGYQWSVINDDDGTTTLASGGTIIPPYKGSLKVTGKNAVVTVLKSGDNEYRVFGQTKEA